MQDVGAITWRLQLGSAFIPAVPLAVLIFFCPESPRWYMKKGRMQDAWRSMRKIRKTEVQAARDLYYAYVQFKEESKVSYKGGIRPPGPDKADYPRQDLLLPVHRAVYHSSMPSGQLCGISCHAGSAAVWHQHHGVL